MPGGFGEKSGLIENDRILSLNGNEGKELDVATAMGIIKRSGLEFTVDVERYNLIVTY